MLRFLSTIILFCLILVVTGQADAYPADWSGKGSNVVVGCHQIKASHSLSDFEVEELADELDEWTLFTDFVVTAVTARPKLADFFASCYDQPPTHSADHPIYITNRRLLI